MADYGTRDGRLGPLEDAALALNAAIRALGIGTSDESIEAFFDQGRASIIEDSAGGDALARQAEVVTAAVGVLLDVASSALQGRGAPTLKTCFKKLPAAPMRWVSGENSTFWVCEHVPTHREA